MFTYIDMDANNVVIIDDSTIVGMTKAGGVATIDITDNTVKHFSTMASIPTGAKGGTASGNFGGSCYLGDGIVAVHLSMNEWDFWVKDLDVVMDAGTAHVAAYQASTGRVIWVTEVNNNGAFANGLFCAPGLVFTAAKGSHLIGLDATTGNQVLSVDVPECGDGAYNCAEAVTDRTKLYVTTSRRFSTYDFARVAN
jgi:outer membrane protein assembly factor BamB